LAEGARAASGSASTHSYSSSNADGRTGGSSSPAVISHASRSAPVEVRAPAAGAAEVGRDVVGRCVSDLRLALKPCHRTVRVALVAEVAHVGGVRPARAGEGTAAHGGTGGFGVVVGVVDDLAAPVDLAGRGAQAGVVVEASRVVAHPFGADADPPVALVELDLDQQVVLVAAGDALGHPHAGERGGADLDPALDIGVVATEVVAALGVSVRRVVDEQVRLPVAVDVLIGLAADLEGLQGGAAAADGPELAEGELVGPLHVGLPGVDIALGAVVGDELVRVGVLVLGADGRRVRVVRRRELTPVGALGQVV